MFEHRLSPLLPLPAFRARMAKMAALGLALIVASLAVGMLGRRRAPPLGLLAST